MELGRSTSLVLGSLPRFTSAEESPLDEETVVLEEEEFSCAFDGTATDTPKRQAMRESETPDRVAPFDKRNFFSEPKERIEIFTHTPFVKIKNFETIKSKAHKTRRTI